MSKGKRQHNFEVPEEQQHEPITMPESVAEITGHPPGTDTEVVPPGDVREGMVMTPDPKSSEVLGRVLSHAKSGAPALPQQIKTMVQEGTVMKSEERVFRCVYDDAATARKVDVGAKDPDVFCQVCGNRMVRER